MMKCLVSFLTVVFFAAMTAFSAYGAIMHHDRTLAAVSINLGGFGLVSAVITLIVVDKEIREITKRREQS